MLTDTQTYLRVGARNHCFGLLCRDDNTYEDSAFYRLAPGRDVVDDETKLGILNVRTLTWEERAGPHWTGAHHQMDCLYERHIAVDEWIASTKVFVVATRMQLHYTYLYICCCLRSIPRPTLLMHY